MTLMLPDDGTELLGSPETAVEGESRVISIEYPDTITVDANSFHVAYLDGEDDSANVLSGSLGGDGTTTLTLKTIAAEVGGNDYIHSFGVTCGGERRVYSFRRIVQRKSGQ
jgi:hypothetical protein